MASQSEHVATSTRGLKCNRLPGEATDDLCDRGRHERGVRKRSPRAIRPQSD